jgi:hypothetical protein
MKKLIKLTLLVCFLPLIAHATTYYVDYTTGNDSNAGTSTGSPWKHAPGMQGLTPAGASTGDGCTGTCASTTINAGDKIILKGGTVWPYTTAPWVFSPSGSSSSQLYGCAGTNCIYVGNAVGAGLSAWNNGTVTSITLKRDLGGWNPGSPPSISCSGGGGSGAAATAHVVPAAETNDPNIAGFIYHISLTSGGSSYTSAPTCTLSGGGIATLVTDINRSIFDLGSTQGSPPVWPIGECGSFPSTCAPGLVITGAYVLINGIEFRNMLTTQSGTGGVDGEERPFVDMQGRSDTVANSYVHGMGLNCVVVNTNCSTQGGNLGAIESESPYQEMASDIVENGDIVFLGTSGQQAAGICNTNLLCGSFAFGYMTGTQNTGPVSVHDSVGFSNTWQLRYIGNDSSGSDPFLSYNNEFWLTTYSANATAHINSRYMQLIPPAVLISHNNFVHSQVGGTSSQMECGSPSGNVTYYFYNEVVWNIGTGTQDYSPGCTIYLYNDTMYANNGGSCVNASSSGISYNITMQNLHCIQTPAAQNPFWATATNANFVNSSGSNIPANVQAASVVQSISTANGQGYNNNNLFSPVSSANATVQFSTSSGTANLTALCSGNFAALCNDINGAARPASGGWQAGAYFFGGSIINPANNPTCSPGTGTYTGTQHPTCSSTSPGAILVYTTDGSTPSTNGSGGPGNGILYTGAITIAASTTLKIVAGGNGYLDSGAVTYIYNIGPFSLIQSPSNLTCTGTGNGTSQTFPCSVTVTATTAGNSLLLLTSFSTNNQTVQATYSSASGDSTWTHCPAQFSNFVAPPLQYANDCAYILSATGGATTITANWVGTVANGISWSIDVQVVELHLSTGSAAFDACTTGTACITTTSSTSPYTSPTFTPTGSADYIAQWISQPGTSCSINGSAYINPFSTETNNVESSFAGALNQSSASAQTWTCGNNPTFAAMSAVALKGTLLPTAGTPTAIPTSGTFTGTQSVALSVTGGAPQIVYTTDGSTPVISPLHGTVYSTAISISSTTILKAIAGGTGYIPGSVATFTYTIGLPPAGTPTCTPPAGTYTAAQTVSCSVGVGTTMYYTTDGSTPSVSGTHGTLYSGAVTVSSTLTFKIVAGDASHVDGSVASYSYTISAVGPSAPWPLFAITTSGTHVTCPTCALKTACLCRASDGNWISINGSGYSPF